MLKHFNGPSGYSSYIQTPIALVDVGCSLADILSGYDVVPGSENNNRNFFVLFSYSPGANAGLLVGATRAACLLFECHVLCRALGT